MKDAFPVLTFAITVLMIHCSTGDRKSSPFSVDESDQVLELKEDGNIVFVYQKQPKTLTGEYICNNYIHPLYDLHGNILTEEFPDDHPYHRGIFWAWHQLYARGKSLGDGWINDSISYEVVSAAIDKEQEKAVLSTDVNWKSSVLGDNTPFMNERTNVTVHRVREDVRIIDFEIRLRALVRNLQIGGSPDMKGYGGFCMRLRLPESLVFTSENGPVIPQELQIKAGPWMDFSGRFGCGREITGITLICPPNIPDYPEPWILRQKGSMQNIVFPGNKRTDVPNDRSIVLRYRLLIHNGDAGNINIPVYKQEYAKIYND